MQRPNAFHVLQQPVQLGDKDELHEEEKQRVGEGRNVGRIDDKQLQDLGVDEEVKVVKHAKNDIELVVEALPGLVRWWQPQAEEFQDLDVDLERGLCRFIDVDLEESRE